MVASHKHQCGGPCVAASTIPLRPTASSPPQDQRARCHREGGEPSLSPGPRPVSGWKQASARVLPPHQEVPRAPGAGENAARPGDRRGRGAGLHEEACSWPELMFWEGGFSSFSPCPALLARWALRVWRGALRSQGCAFSCTSTSSVNLPLPGGREQKVEVHQPSGGVIAGLPPQVLAGPWGCGLAGSLGQGTGLCLRATGSGGLPEVGPRHGQTR